MACRLDSHRNSNRRELKIFRRIEKVLKPPARWLPNLIGKNFSTSIGKVSSYLLRFGSAGRALCRYAHCDGIFVLVVPLTWGANKKNRPRTRTRLLEFGFAQYLAW